MAFLTSKLNHPQKKTIQNQKDTIRAQIARHGEKPGGIWSVINRQKKPRDIIPRLQKPNTNLPQYEKSTTQMAKLARDYHKNLQKDRINNEEENGRAKQIEKALAHLLEEQTIKDHIMTQILAVVVGRTHVQFGRCS